MAITNATFKTGTALAATGGTDLTLVSIGSPKAGQARYSPSVDTTEVSRRRLFVSSTPAPSAPGSTTGYGKAQQKIVYYVPREVSTGVWEDEIIEVTRRVPVTVTASQAEESLENVAQFIYGTPFRELWTLGATG